MEDFGTQVLCFGCMGLPTPSVSFYMNPFIRCEAFAVSGSHSGRT